MSAFTIRENDLRQMLNERRRAIGGDVQTRLRDRRSDQTKEVHDDLEDFDAHLQQDIELEVIQMRAQTAIRIEEALERLDAGRYGSCAECAGEIAARRLRALPFAVRCQACEEKREQMQGRARQRAQRSSDFPLFPSIVGA